MSTQLQLNQGTINKVSQEYYIPIAVNDFLLDRKAQNLVAGTHIFYQVKLTLFLSFCDTQVIKTQYGFIPESIRQYLFSLESSGHNAGGIGACFRVLRTNLLWWEAEYEPEGWKNPIRKVKALIFPIY